MALPFLKQTNITHFVNILHHLYHFPGPGVHAVVSLGLGVARGEMAAILYSVFLVSFIVVLAQTKPLSSIFSRQQIGLPEVL